MLKRVQITSVLFLWFLATGAQWDVVQTFGWARMVTQYAQSMSLAEAVKKTFSGDMCGVCEVVREAKQQSESSKTFPHSEKTEGKLVLSTAPSAEFTFTRLSNVVWKNEDVFVPSFGRASPPTPPPRA
ncbi:MAG TPA: hypothetical protein PLN52_25720 [Opitutaceae bacterium]|nr:hypothetical protein [Opitutaceae bacterium]